MSTAVIVLIALCPVAFLFGLYLLIFRKGRRKQGFLVAISAPVIMGLLAIVGSNLDAIDEGWSNTNQKLEAEAAGVTDAAEWQKRLADEQAAKDQAVADKKAADKVAGFHCLSAWDGTNSTFIDLVKSNLRDPNSFEHDETKIAPVNEKGQHIALMSYRARNGFGGMNVATAMAAIDHETCAVELLSIE